jgi:hypothetical protein
VATGYFGEALGVALGSIRLNFKIVKLGLTRGFLALAAVL